MGDNIDKCIEAKKWDTLVEIIDIINIWGKVYHKIYSAADPRISKNLIIGPKTFPKNLIYHFYTRTVGYKV